MKDARPQLPSGNSPRMFFARCVWWALWGGRFPFANSDTVTVEYTSGHYYFKAKTIRPGLTGWHRPSSGKYELPAAPYPAFDKDTVIHIQSTHSIVTTGIADAANPTGGLITSCPGLWLALQDVPAQTTVSGTDVWNVPQNPMPTPGNLDDSANYWYYLGEINC